MHYIYCCEQLNSFYIRLKPTEFSVYLRKKGLSNESTLYLYCPQIILEIRKEGDYRIPTWIIIGSTLGGLLLLALLSLALWKVSHRIINPREENILK